MTKTTDSSLELYWDRAIHEIDTWAEQARSREDMLLQTINDFVENAKRNQTNLKDFIEQFTKELQEWEKTSREEFLVKLAPIQHVFPIISNEEINQKLDNVQEKTGDFVLKPVRSVIQGNQLDHYLSSIERYIRFRRRNREIYIRNVKEAASVLSRNQNDFVKMITREMTNMFYPFRKYIDNPNNDLN